MANKAKVSVIVPVYKAAGTMEVTINSIQNQTYKDIEIILVDDGSPDNCGVICDKLAAEDSRIKVIHQKNSGVSAARNAGLKEVTAEYLCFVDSDDELTPDFVEKMFNNVITAQADIVICGMAMYHKDLTEISKEKESVLNLNTMSPDEFFALFENWIMMPMCGKLFKSSIIFENNLRLKEGLVCGEDHLFNFEYLNYCNNISFIDDVLYKYFCFRSNGTARFFPLSGQISIFEAKKALLEKHCSEETISSYCAKTALHNLSVRVNYLAKRQIWDEKEILTAYNYYWKFIEPFKENKSVFDATDYLWFERNRNALLNADAKSLLKDAKIQFRKKSTKYRHIKEFKAMTLKEKINFIFKKIVRLVKR